VISVLIFQTQFMSTITGTVLYPHLYEDGIDNRVVALTKVMFLLRIIVYTVTWSCVVDLTFKNLFQCHASFVKHDFVIEYDIIW